MKELQFLEEQGVSPKLIQEVESFRKAHTVSDEVKNRIVKPPIPFYGKEILEMAIAALLQGENVLLSGSKATGKNILAENHYTKVTVKIFSEYVPFLSRVEGLNNMIEVDHSADKELEEAIRQIILNISM